MFIEINGTVNAPYSFFSNPLSALHMMQSLLWVLILFFSFRLTTVTPLLRYLREILQSFLQLLIFITNLFTFVCMARPAFPNSLSISWSSFLILLCNIKWKNKVLWGTQKQKIISFHCSTGQLPQVWRENILPIQFMPNVDLHNIMMQAAQMLCMHC